MPQFTWTQTGEHDWVSVPGLYRLEENPATGNVFVYRVTHSRNHARGKGHYDALLNARYNLADAQQLAQDHADGKERGDALTVTAGGQEFRCDAAWTPEGLRVSPPGVVAFTVALPEADPADPEAARRAAVSEARGILRSLYEPELEA